MNDQQRSDPARVSEPMGEADIRHWLAAIVDSSDDAIISKNLDGMILTWNRAAQRLLGFSASESIGRSVTMIIPPELRQEERDILIRLQAGERIEHFATRRLTRDGRLLDVSLTISPVRDRNGRIIGASKILRDITESRLARAALQESQRQLAHEIANARTLQSISTRLISELRGRPLSAGIVDAAVELMGSDCASVQVLASDGETLLLLCSKNFHPISAAFWQRVTADAASTCGAALRHAKRVLVSDVESCEFMAGTQDLQEYRRSGIRAVQSTPLRSRGGRPLGILSTHWRAPHTPTEDDFRLFDVLARQAADLIEHTRAEDAVRESEERFRLISNTAPVAIWTTNADKQCTYVNETWLEWTGQSLDLTLGAGWTNAIHPEDVVQCWDTYATAFDRRESFHVEYRIARPDGECRWIFGTGVPRYTADSSFAGFIGSALDVTEHKRAKEALATIDQRLIEAQEEERARIARELHDDVVQRLSLLNLRLHGLMHSGPGSTSAEREEIEQTSAEIAGLARDVQTLSRRLHPPRLDYLGIEAAAMSLCRELSKRHGVEISFDCSAMPKELSKHVNVCVYRVLQEALQNAIKYSGSARIEVLLRCAMDRIELTVRDFGIGLEPEKLHGAGLGMTSMKERLKALRGQLVVRSQPGQGTTIEARVPLSPT